jgi:sialidase-1
MVLLICIGLTSCSKDEEDGGNDAVGDCAESDLFVSGEDGYNTYRIPALLVTPDGSVLAFCEGRVDSPDDWGDIDVVMKKSTDGGKTFGDLRLVADYGGDTIGNPCPVVDESTGTILLCLTSNLAGDNIIETLEGTGEGTREVWVTESTDNGETWTELENITDLVKEPEWTWYATGPGHGIQLASGRLVIPCDHGETMGTTHHLYAHVLCSDDGGETWQISNSLEAGTEECEAAELDDGSLLLTVRNYHDIGEASFSRSYDQGLMWTTPVEYNDALFETEPDGCQSSLISYDDTLIFSGPASLKREKMTVCVSSDNGETWPVQRLLYEGPSAYSNLCMLSGGDIFCLYENGRYNPYDKITLARFSLQWLEQ